MGRHTPRPVTEVGPDNPLFGPVADFIRKNFAESESVVYRAGRFVLANNWITLYDTEESAQEVYEEAVEYFTDPQHAVGLHD